MKIHCLYDKMVLVSDLVLHPKNSNSHPKDQIERLGKILKYQGWRYPIKVSKRSNYITSGHGRLAAAIFNGWREVPVNYQDYESEEQEIADLHADNAIASWSELDLSSINEQMLELGPDFDVDLLGIRNFEIEPADKIAGCDEDEVPEHVDAKTKLGDIYKLGEHRLLCGDSTMIDDVEKLMNGEKADMVFTDPPYNTGMQAKADSTRLNHMFNDKFTDEEWQNLLEGFTANMWAVMKENSTAYVCLDWRRSHELVPHLKGKFKFSNLIVWDKLVHGLGSDYKYTHELIHVCKKGSPEIKSHQGEKEYQDVWRIQRKMGRDEEHATKKPIEIIERALKHASLSGHNVLDLFGGSGSTLIACEKTNRKCYAMELDPKYCDVIVSRWERYTGKKAELINV